MVITIMSNMSYYYEKTTEKGYEYYVVVPTGKWKIKYGPYDNGDLYIEIHWNKYFNRWIHEDYLVLKPSLREYINQC